MDTIDIIRIVIVVVIAISYVIMRKKYWVES